MKIEKMIQGSGNLELFASLCEEHRTVMFATARSALRGRNAHFVDDCVQLAMIKIAQNINYIKSCILCSKRRSFIVTIVRNTAIDIIRRESRVEIQSTDEIDFSLEGSAKDPLDEIIEQESYETILKALRSLDERHRVVLEYRLLHELSDKEIADLLNITPKNANIRVYRAKQKLRSLLMDKEDRHGKR